jgi:hypothetical protein
VELSSHEVVRVAKVVPFIGLIWVGVVPLCLGMILILASELRRPQ